MGSVLFQTQKALIRGNMQKCPPSFRNAYFNGFIYMCVCICVQQMLIHSVMFTLRSVITLFVSQVAIHVSQLGCTVQVYACIF